MDSITATPAEEYQRQLEGHEAEAARWNSRHYSLGYVRLLLIAIFLVLFWACIAAHLASRLWVAVPLILFAAVAAYHSAVLGRKARAQRSAEIYARGLARIEDRWAGTNPRPAPFDVSAHLYASDLDILGTDGLFELLCTARTEAGEEELLRWLLSPATPEEARGRQQAIAELRGKLDFRERMAIAGERNRPARPPAAVKPVPWGPASAKAAQEAPSLLAWAEAPDTLRQRWWPPLAAVLAVLALVALGGWLGRGFFAPLFFVLVLQAALRLPLKRPIAAVLDGLDETLEPMRLVSTLLQAIEEEQFHAPLLREIQAKLQTHTMPASRAIAELASLGRYRDSLDNPLIRVLNLPLLYSVQLAFAVARWRRRHGAAVRLWLRALGEAEALLSLAAYSYEHPADPFPEFFASDGSFDAQELGHPLLPASRCVRNDVCLGGSTRVLLVSGSNMSGKSTLMRAVGVNTVLAMCGAPVRARHLRLSPLRIGASLLLNDSLKSGQSRFYAEIERLREICGIADAAKESGSAFRVLFLLDELLQGTNSRDRLIGARGVIGALVEAGALGIVTTHDLTLTEMDGLAPGVLRNAHFQEQFVDGTMSFDFRMREGVVATTNGSELMRLIGLKV